MVMNKVDLVIFGCLLCVAVSSALTCYECTDCDTGDTFNTSAAQTTTCTQRQTSCMVTIDGNKANRSCSDACKESGTVKCCNKDNCNVGVCGNSFCGASSGSEATSVAPSGGSGESNTSSGGSSGGSGSSSDNSTASSDNSGSSETTTMAPSGSKLSTQSGGSGGSGVSGGSGDIMMTTGSPSGNDTNNSGNSTGSSEHKCYTCYWNGTHGTCPSESYASPTGDQVACAGSANGKCMLAVYTESNVTMVMRGCADNECAGDTSVHETDGGKLYCCTGSLCNKNLCNGKICVENTNNGNNGANRTFGSTYWLFAILIMTSFINI